MKPWNMGELMEDVELDDPRAVALRADAGRAHDHLLEIRDAFLDERAELHEVEAAENAYMPLQLAYDQHREQLTREQGIGL